MLSLRQGLTKLVEPLAMEEHLGTVIGQQGAGAQLQGLGLLGFTRLSYRSQRRKLKTWE
jgi:hypothetical protein